MTNDAHRCISRSDARDVPHGTISGEPPILRPASRSRLRGRSGSERGGEAGPSFSSSPVPIHPRKSSNPPGVNSTRHTSRGRERSSRQGLRRQGSSDLSQHRRGSRTGSRAEETDVDLSQYNLIEEFRSAECPVHGSRSNSTAPNRPGSRQRESTPRRDRHRLASREQREPRHSSRDSQSPAISRNAVSQNLVGASMQSRPTKKPSKDRLVSRKMTQSVQIGMRDRKTKAAETPRAQQATITESSTLDWRQGPKTPVAMILFSEIQAPVDQPLESPPIKGTNVVLVSRPRSAVW